MVERILLRFGAKAGRSPEPWKIRGSLTDRPLEFYTVYANTYCSINTQQLTQTNAMAEWEWTGN